MILAVDVALGLLPSFCKWLFFRFIALMRKMNVKARTQLNDSIQNAKNCVSKFHAICLHMCPLKVTKALTALSDAFAKTKALTALSDAFAGSMPLKTKALMAFSDAANCFSRNGAFCSFRTLIFVEM